MNSCQVFSLSDLLGPFETLSVIGGGGKTSLLEYLERELFLCRQTVLVSTTTKVGAWQFKALEKFFTHCYGDLVMAAKLAQAGWRLFLAGHEKFKKLNGPQIQWLMRLKEDFPKLKILLEADGSQGMPLKAHASYEPVIIDFPGQLVLGVLGLRGLEEKFAQSFQRPEIFTKITGRHLAPDHILKPIELADFFETIFNAPIKASYARMNTLILNQADSTRRQELGLELANCLTSRKLPIKIILASVQNGFFTPL